MGRSSDSPALANSWIGVRNLKSVYGKADDMDKDNGISYYLRFHNRLKNEAARLGFHDMVKIAGVYAALSPNNSEESNVYDMLRAIVCFSEDNWDSLTVHTYGLNKEKAKRILGGESPHTVLGGPKTKNFYHNILEPHDERYCTIDGHMVNMYNGARVPLDNAGISESEYGIIARAVAEVAEDVGMIPCQLQSTLWLTWRRIHRIYYKPQFCFDFGVEG